ncbi:MAG: hypothetical protein GJ680_07815 [Alteromonadaceae bacterium]|nr:hypothetical protein [Alteromonadaceae bacterium]
MNKIATTLFAAAALTSLSATATISVSDTNSASIELSGVVSSQCKINNDGAGTASLDMSSSSAQSIGVVNTWCNSGGSTATVTYASINAGQLISDGGAQVAYALDVVGVQTGINLTTPQSVTQTIGTGSDGTSAATSLNIAPVVTGFEDAGTYSDTITITIAPN